VVLAEVHVLLVDHACAELALFEVFDGEMVVVLAEVASLVDHLEDVRIVVFKVKCTYLGALVLNLGQHGAHELDVL